MSYCPCAAQLTTTRRKNQDGSMQAILARERRPSVRVNGDRNSPISLLLRGLPIAKVDNLDTPVFLSPLLCRVIGDRFLFPVPDGNGSFLEAVTFTQVMCHTLGTTLRESLIIRIAADTVSVPFNLKA